MRGARTTAEHLSVLDYKIQQDKIRTVTLDDTISDKEQTAAALKEQVEKKQAQLAHW